MPLLAVGGCHGRGRGGCGGGFARAGGLLRLTTLESRHRRSVLEGRLHRLGRLPRRLLRLSPRLRTSSAGSRDLGGLLDRLLNLIGNLVISRLGVGALGIDLDGLDGLSILGLGGGRRRTPSAGNGGAAGASDDGAEGQRRVPYAFLDDVKDRFKAAYGETAQTAIAFSMNEEFGRTLQGQMEYFNGPNGDSLGTVQGKLEDVKNVMVQNIEMVLERGEKLELLVDKTDALQSQAFQFNKSSKKLRQAMFWKKMKCYALIFFAVAMVIVFISMMACGGPAYTNCRDGNDD